MYCVLLIFGFVFRKTRGLQHIPPAGYVKTPHPLILQHQAMNSSFTGSSFRSACAFLLAPEGCVPRDTACEEPPFLRCHAQSKRLPRSHHSCAATALLPLPRAQDRRAPQRRARRHARGRAARVPRGRRRGAPLPLPRLDHLRHGAERRDRAAQPARRRRRVRPPRHARVRRAARWFNDGLLKFLLLLSRQNRARRLLCASLGPA